MITLSEYGNVPNISSQWNKGAKWFWFMPWNYPERMKDINDADFTETDHKFANIIWWNDVLNQEYVIARDEIPSLK